LKTFNQRRISDVSFTIDCELNVNNGNRSFLRLFDVTDSRLQLSDYMEDSDCENFKCYLKNFGKNSDSSNNPYFIANISPNKRKLSSSDNIHKSCLFFIEKKDENLFKVEVKELSYSKQLLDKALLESREYTALLSNFDANYFVYNGEKFTIKNTRDKNVLFEGDFKSFKTYFGKSFAGELDSTSSKIQFDSMFEDLKSFITGKNYVFLKNDKTLLTVHTSTTGTRDKSLIIGNITFGGSEKIVQNLYSETKDGLTDLYTKKAITEIAIQKINEAKNPVSLIIMDVDKFKECNDTYGHTFGDKVLVSVSKCIKEAINGVGIAGRIGGDEFLIILDKTDEKDIRNITRNIRIGIQWSIEAESPESVVTCSMGIARAPLNANNYEDLFKIADKCLYIAKDKGRNCYIIYKPELHSSVIVDSEKNSNSQTLSEYYLESATDEYEILTSIHKLRHLDKNEESTKEEVSSILKKVCKYIPVSQLSVYKRENEKSRFERLYFIENDSSNHSSVKEDVRKSYFDLEIYNDDNYFKYSTNNFLHLDNTNILDTLDKTIYEMYICANVASTIESFNNNILFCYDILKPARTFRKEKIIFATLIAKLLSDLI